MIIDILLGLGVLSSVSIIFFIFQVFLPYRSPIDLNLSKIKENAKKYDRLELSAVLWTFVVSIPIGYSAYYTGLGLNETLLDSSYQYLMKAPTAFWGFLGVVFAVGTLKQALEFLYKLILKDEYNLYTHYTNLKHGWDGEKIWRPVERFLIIAGIILFVLGQSWYVRIDNKTIRLK